MRIFKIYKYTIAFFFLLNFSFGQAKKPTLMVVPSDNWCITNGFTIEFDNQGTKEVIPSI